MISIKIDGVVYNNVSKPTPKVQYEFAHDVVTMDGVRHRELSGKRTNYSILFFNKNLTEYDELKSKLLSTPTVYLEVPNGATSFHKGEYYVTVNGDEPKGMMYQGTFYNTALSVEFEKVGYDE